MIFPGKTSIAEAVLIADRIPGWCELDELRWLAEHAAHRNFVVEVGCWQGRSCKVMALVCPGTVFAVDDWRGAGGADHDGMFGPEGFPLGINSTPHDELERRFRQNLKTEIATRKVVVTGKPSPAAATGFGLGSLDMVYIDGDHDTDPVRADIQAWRPLLAEGGLLCGHDGPDPRVASALDAEGLDWEIVASNIWAARL